jgi:Kef-type K+ transport system membrane component KefB
VDVILDVFVIFVSAKAAAELFVRLSLPAIAGELLVGILLGPHVAGVVKITQSTTVLADLGVVILLFTVGLETPLSDLVRVGWSALLTSVSGVMLAALTGIGVFMAFGAPTREGLLAGTALAASSVGVAARVFQDLGLISSRQARVVLGAAVLDDVIALALFPLMEGVGKGGSSIGAILIGLAGAAAFLIGVLTIGARLARRHADLLDRPRVGRSPFVLALALCLGLAALAEQVGLAALVGAFVAGMMLADTRERFNLDRRMQPLVDFLVPFFFVISAARMDPGRVLSGRLGLALSVIGVTLVAKIVGCALGARGLSPRERLQVGLGMLPRNEVTLVVASAGLAAGIFDRDGFSVLVAAVVVSTLVAPALLRLAIPGGARARREGEFGDRPPESPGRADAEEEHPDSL